MKDLKKKVKRSKESEECVRQIGDTMDKRKKDSTRRRRYLLTLKTALSCATFCVPPKRISKVLRCKVRLVPYKLNVYSEGDFFLPHVDTPIDPQDMIGSLVIGLSGENSRHEG